MKSPRQRPGALVAALFGLGLGLNTAALAAEAPVVPAAPAVPAASTATAATPDTRLPGAPGPRLAELPALLKLPASLSLGEGEGQGAPLALTLAAALPRGVANNREVRAAEARRESFELSVQAAQGATLPQLSLRIGQGRGQLDTPTTQEEMNRLDSTLAVRHAVYDRPARLEVDRQGTLVRSAEQQWRAAVSTASVDMASAYLQALQTRVTLELSREHEARLGELYEYIHKRAEAGGTSTAERDRVKARVANARAQMADARATLRASLRNLESQLGAAPAGLVLEAPRDLHVPADAVAAYEEARQFNADVGTERLEIEAVRLEASSHGAKRWPRVELEFTHNHGVNAAGVLIKQRDTRGMLVVSWTLADGGTANAQERAALARQREKQLRLEEVERKLRQELDLAYANLEAVGERYAALRTELEANTTVVQAFQAQLVGGNRQLLDVLDAYQRLYQTRLDLAALVVGEVQNQVKVAHLTGRLFNLGWRP